MSEAVEKWWRLLRAQVRAGHRCPTESAPSSNRSSSCALCIKAAGVSRYRVHDTQKRYSRNRSYPATIGQSLKCTRLGELAASRTNFVGRLHNVSIGVSGHRCHCQED